MITNNKFSNFSCIEMYKFGNEESKKIIFTQFMGQKGITAKFLAIAKFSINFWEKNEILVNNLRKI